MFLKIYYTHHEIKKVNSQSNQFRLLRIIRNKYYLGPLVDTL